MRGLKHCVRKDAHVRCGEFIDDCKEAVATSQKDDAKHFVDQVSNFGSIFTKLAPAARLSKTPSYSATGSAIVGAHDPFTTGRDEAPKDNNGEVTHLPSKMGEHGFFGFLESFGHEDIMLRKT